MTETREKEMNMEQKDELLHITLMDGMVRGLLLTATRTVAEAAAIHLTSPVATAALGRALMGTAMMGAMLKDDQASVTVTFDGGGPLGPHRLRGGPRKRAGLCGASPTWKCRSSPTESWTWAAPWGMRDA